MSELDPRRRNRITSSTAADCLGKGRWGDPFTAWDQIVNQPESETTPAQERGNYLEEPCIRWGCRHLGLDILDIKHPGFRPHEDWLGSSIDAMYHEHPTGKLLCGVEAKTAGPRMMEGWGEPGSDNVPRDVYIQCCVHLACWPELTKIAVPMLGGWDLTFSMYWVHRDDALIADVLGRLRKFYDRYIVTGVEPPAGDKSKGALDRMFPHGLEGEILAPTSDLEKLARSYNEIRGTAKAATADKTEAANLLRQAMGDHTDCNGDGWSISWRSGKRGRTLRVAVKG